MRIELAKTNRSACQTAANRKSALRAATRIAWGIIAAVACAAALSAFTPSALAQGTTLGVTELDKLPKVRTDYPVPDDPNVLFYVQRSQNANTIVYAAKLDGAGRLDPHAPVQVFWRRYDNEGGVRKSLSFAERNVAFGIDAKPAPGRNDAWLVNVVSYPARKALVEMDKKGKPQAVVEMGSRLAKLAYAYIQLNEGSGTIPSIAYVDLYGYDVANGRVLRERIKPGKTGGN